MARRAPACRGSAYLPIALVILTLWLFLHWEGYKAVTVTLERAARVVAGPRA